MDRRSRWMRWGAVSAAAVVALTGCDGGEEPNASIEPTSQTASPSSDEELRSQAEIVYSDYLAEVAAMYASNDDDYTRLLEWATPEMATHEAAGVADLAESGVTTSDWYTVSAFELGAVDERGIRINACVDVADVTLIGPGGEDVTPTDREPLVPLALHFTREGDLSLLLDAQDPWNPEEGQSPCEPLS